MQYRFVLGWRMQPPCRMTCSGSPLYCLHPSVSFDVARVRVRHLRELERHLRERMQLAHYDFRYLSGPWTHG
jgi:hypothetical protein